MFCLITDLHDWEAYPAGTLAAAYKWRWDGSETRCARPSPRSAAPGRPPGRSSGPAART